MTTDQPTAEQLAADIDEQDSTISSLRAGLDFQTKAAFANQAEASRLAAELDALDNRVRLLLITPDGDRQDHETITVAELRNAIDAGTAPVPGSSQRAQEAGADVLEKAKPWATPCGRCDYGMPMDCTCTGDDPRPVMARLVAEIERLRNAQGWDPSSPQWAVIRAAIAWRKRIVDPPNLWADDTDFALIEAVDALPHAGESQASEPAATAATEPTQDADAVRTAGQALLDVLQTFALPFEANRAAYRLRLALGAAPEPAAPKLAQGGRRNGCGPDCSEGHTYEAGCAIEPPARAFLGERPCGKPGCPCGGTAERPIDLDDRATQPALDDCGHRTGPVAGCTGWRCTR